MQKIENLGGRIRALRGRKGWTLQNLSARSGLSVSFLSEVERGNSSLSIVSLTAICEALEVPLTEILVDDEPSASTIIIKAGNQPCFHIPNSPITYRWLSGDFPGRVIEVLIGEFPPNYQHPLSPHEGEEFGYVLEGHLVLKIGGEEYLLGPGDSYHFRATIPHGYETSDQEGAKVLWAITQKFIAWHAKVKNPTAG